MAMNTSKLSKVCALCAAGAMSAMVAGAETISSPSGNVVGVGGEVKPAETAWNVKGI